MFKLYWLYDYWNTSYNDYQRYLLFVQIKAFSRLTVERNRSTLRKPTWSLWTISHADMFLLYFKDHSEFLSWEQNLKLQHRERGDYLIARICWSDVMVLIEVRNDDRLSSMVVRLRGLIADFTWSYNWVTRVWAWSRVRTVLEVEGTCFLLLFWLVFFSWFEQDFWSISVLQQPIIQTIFELEISILKNIFSLMSRNVSTVFQLCNSSQLS